MHQDYYRYFSYFTCSISLVLFHLFHQLLILQDVGNDTYDICDVSVIEKKIVVTYGQSVHLGCFVKIPEILKDQEVVWYHAAKKIDYSPSKYIATTERGLAVLSLSEEDSGRYDCHLGGSLLCSFNISVDSHR
jgi:hypothetical protein